MNSSASASPTVRRAQRLYRDDNARRLFDWIAGNNYTGGATRRPSGKSHEWPAVSEVEEFERSGNEYLHFSRSQIVQLFKEMDTKKLGTFVLGRKEWPSRFEWTYTPMSVAACAQGRADELEAVEAVEETEEEPTEEVYAFTAVPHHGRLARHEYALPVRDGQVAIAMPADATSEEAEQVATYLEGVASLIRATLVKRIS